MWRRSRALDLCTFCLLSAATTSRPGREHTTNDTTLTVLHTGTAHTGLCHSRVSNQLLPAAAAAAGLIKFFERSETISLYYLQTRTQVDPLLTRARARDLRRRRKTSPRVFKLKANEM